MKTFAIAYANRPTKVVLWCKHRGRDGDGKKFEVINGGWDGSIASDGRITVHRYRGTDLPRGLIVWEGDVPRTHADDYNDAIRWIESALNPATEIGIEQ